MIFVTYLDEHLQRCYTTVHHYMAAICAAHIALGLPNTLQNCPHLQQLTICQQQPQPQLDSGCQGITMEFLWRARPLHQLHLPKDSVLWAALTLGHNGFFHSGKITQMKLADPGVLCFIHFRDITPHFSQGHLHYVRIMFSSSKMDPFHLGCPVIIGCTGTLECGVCEAWSILQHHQQTQTSPDAPFLQINGRTLDRLTLVRHIKDIAACLGLNPSRYSGHSLHIGGATSAAQVGLSQWQIKLLGRWNSQAYQVYICQDPLACAGLAAHMTAHS